MLSLDLQQQNFFYFLMTAQQQAYKWCRLYTLIMLTDLNNPNTFSHVLSELGLSRIRLTSLSDYPSPKREKQKDLLVKKIVSLCCRH